MLQLSKGSADKYPLFMVHGIGGTVFNFRDLAVGLKQQVYAIQSQALDKISSPHISLPEMAANYCNAVRTVQKHGPYLLAGHSFGGVVAYEMAQQFFAEGEKVQHLVMFDTNLQHKSAQMPKITDAVIVAYMIYANFGVIVESNILHGMNKKQLFEYFCQHNKEAGNCLEISDFTRLLEIIMANSNALRNYVFQKYQQTTSVTYYRAAERDKLDFGSYEPWQELIGSQLTIKDVSGGHHTMLQHPYINEGLANDLMSKIDCFENL